MEYLCASADDWGTARVSLLDYVMKLPSEGANQAVLPFIEGEPSTSSSDETVEVLSPSNGKPLLLIPAGCDADVDRAVASARRAFDDGRWSDGAPSWKKKTLHRFADMIAARASELDVLDAGEMGKPVAETFCNAAAAADLVRFYAEAVDKVAGDVLTSDRYSFVAQRRIPRGVVAAVTPWNFPAFIALLKAAPALAAGNCVVLKPSEMSSRSALRLAQLAVEAGLPPGVLNVVPGRGDTVGRALALHMDIDMVTFTGSTKVGKLMLQYAGQSNMKVVMAECGGKSPHIVFADHTAIDAVGEAIAQRLVTNQGQICSVGSRLLVQKSVEAPLVEKILARLGQVVMGDPLNPKTSFGPLASAIQYDRVMNYIRTAEQEGARLIAGGKQALSETGGYFVKPTLFSNVSPSARVAQEEIFGPVLSVIPFEEEAEAIRIANSTIYGLTASVWTDDLSRGLRMAKSIRSSVRINAAVPREGAGLAASSEPVRQSGIGVEGGLAGLESYLRRQLVTFAHA